MYLQISYARIMYKTATCTVYHNFYSSMCFQLQGRPLPFWGLQAE